jgi:arylamine N-acetyltransferase
MLSKKDVLSAVVGLSMMALPASALASGHFNTPTVPSGDAWQPAAISSPIVLAQYDEDHYHHHHHHYEATPNDYDWGGHYRYKYPPSYFNSPMPHNYSGGQRAYLENRRQTAIMMQREMLARGDKDAANRLGATISQLDRQLGR